MKIKIVTLSVILLLFSGCSINRLAMRSVSNIIEYTLQAFYEERDPEFAEEAIAGQLKMLEGLLLSDPGNEEILLTASQGFFSYALAFIEDRDKKRAEDFYKRGMNYGLEVLDKKKNISGKMVGSADEFENIIKTFGMESLPALFWTANNWGSIINLNKNSPENLINTPKAQAMMMRVIELDETYYYGSAHLFFGILLCRAEMLGGDLDKSKEHFLKAIEITGGKYLMSKVFFARHYAVQLLNRELFEKTLSEVIASPEDILPEQILVNVLAQRKAQKLLEDIDEYF